MLDYIAISGNISLYVNVLEQAAAIIVCLDDPLRAARLAGVAEANREESGMLISPQEAAMTDEYRAPARAAVTPQEWQAALAAGRALSQAEALALLRPEDLTGKRALKCADGASGVLRGPALRVTWRNG